MRRGSFQLHFIQYWSKPVRDIIKSIISATRSLMQWKVWDPFSCLGSLSLNVQIMLVQGLKALWGEASAGSSGFPPKKILIMLLLPTFERMFNAEVR